MGYIDESAKRQPDVQFMHIRLKSRKYKVSYEVFWSEKFIHDISTLENRHLTTMLKQIKLGKLEDDSSKDITQDWLIIKNLTKDRDEGDLKEMWLRLNKQLLESTETDAIMEDFESQL